MGALTDARQAISDAVSATGIDCYPYPPDAVSGAVAFVDTISVDYSSGSSFCLTGQATAQLLTVAPRHDKAGSTMTLEDLVPGVVAAVEGLAGVRIAAVESGSADIAGTSLPAVLYTLMFSMAG